MIKPRWVMTDPRTQGNTPVRWGTKLQGLQEMFQWTGFFLEEIKKKLSHVTTC